MVLSQRNPHAGLPFTDDDDAIAAALEDVSIPALLCSLVHLSGDPSWIRGDLCPQSVTLNEYQGFMSEEMKAEARRRALPAIAAYRDSGCVLPPQPSTAVIHEMMSFLACAPVPADVVPMFLEDLHLDGSDAGAITWGDEIPPEVRADCHVIVIGCGEAGLLAGIRLAQAGIPYTIVEKNAGPGGTWWENHYPGARVDIGSHFYCYSFEPADHWSEYFSQQPELRAYFERVMSKYGIGANVRFNTEVTAATFHEDSGRWSVTVRTADGGAETLDARAVISAAGALNQPRMPDIAGMDEFRGPLFHSARWDSSVDYRGTRFALIGAGASGFQIAPTIADDVAQLSVYQRTAQWVFPNANYHRGVPDGDQWAMRHLPFYGRWFRFLMFYPGAGLTIEGSRIDPNYDDGGQAISARNRERREIIAKWMTDQIGDDPELLAKVMPDYPATAKRMLQDNGSWLACLRKPNVELVRTGIERVVEDGVITVDGVFRPADVICYATGFRHNDYLWPMTITGRDGQILREQWGDEPTAYLGITVPNFPNLFCLYGPGTNLAHGGSLIFQSECQMHYIMSALRELLRRGAKAIEPRLDVHDEYSRHYQDEIGQMVWAHPSVKHSHYKNPDGRVFTLSPWPIPTYWGWTKSFEPRDYVFD
ncbi:MAG TPA: NAD(P)/FAD-dependent oxidoreductase [Acidimicrobiales bacterium]|jgi:4-hydroxyacetophenone monooxygenase|nr:NAD(P)/FAD-dependent oxidoreductase [Acidimicrobiales bacterium]